MTWTGIVSFTFYPVSKKMDIQIRLLRIADLENFVASDEYRRMPVLPISPCRAHSQALNPRARPDDLALALAYADGELLGYLGALPDVLHLGGEQQRGAWLSCLWVSPAARGRGLAKQLIGIVSEQYAHRLLLSGFTPEVAHLYRQTMEEMNVTDGLRGYLRPNLTDLLPPKGRWWLRAKPLLGLLDGLLAWPNALRLGLHGGADFPCRVRYMAGMDAAAGAFIAARLSGGLIQSGPDVLDWWLRHPWVEQAPVADEMAERYYFTAVARQFSVHALQLLDEQGAICGVLVLTLRDGHLRVPFAFFDDERTALVARVVFAYALRSGADMMTVYCPRLTAYGWQNRTPFYALRRLRRTFFVTKSLAAQLGGAAALMMQDGEGDLGFT